MCWSENAGAEKIIICVAVSCSTPDARASVGVPPYERLPRRDSPFWCTGLGFGGLAFLRLLPSLLACLLSLPPSFLPPSSLLPFFPIIESLSPFFLSRILAPSQSTPKSQRNSRQLEQWKSFDWRKMGATATRCLLDATVKGHLTTVRQALAVGPAPQQRRFLGWQLWSPDKSPFPVSSHPQLPIPFPSPGPSSASLDSPSLSASSRPRFEPRLQAQMSITPTGKVEASANHDFLRLGRPQRPLGVSCVLLVPKPSEAQWLPTLPS